MTVQCGETGAKQKPDLDVDRKAQYTQMIDPFLIRDNQHC